MRCTRSSRWTPPATRAGSAVLLVKPPLQWAAGVTVCVTPLSLAPAFSSVALLGWHEIGRAPSDLAPAAGVHQHPAVQVAVPSVQAARRQVRHGAIDEQGLPGGPRQALLRGPGKVLSLRGGIRSTRPSCSIPDALHRCCTGPRGPSSQGGGRCITAEWHCRRGGQRTRHGDGVGRAEVNRHKQRQQHRSRTTPALPLSSRPRRVLGGCRNTGAPSSPSPSPSKLPPPSETRC